MLLPAHKVKNVRDVGEVLKVTNEPMLKQWVAISAHINGLNESELYQFMASMFPLKGANFFIMYQGNEPSGVGQVFIDDQKSAYVSSIGVLDRYRKQGLGTKIINKILHFSVHEQVKVFNLHATDMGAYLYNKLGFQLSKQCSFKIIERG